LEAEDVLLDFFDDEPNVFRNLTRRPIMSWLSGDWVLYMFIYKFIDLCLMDGLVEGLRCTIILDADG
jgi:hypothetical protein